MSSARTSGHPLADRRFDYAIAYKDGGELTAAVELLGQALELAPDWAPGWTTLGEWHEASGDRATAIDAYRRALALDAADTSGAGARLARLGAHPADGAVSQAHVAALFDDYAPRFEASLVKGLAYRGPALLREALTDLQPGRGFRRMLDLGCGTGLAGEAFADLCERMEGVDLSPAMLAIAARKKIYARLVPSDVLDFLGAELSRSADLILAADVFVYLGDLAVIFQEVARVLGPGGVFAFTVQHHDGEEPFLVGQDLRYAHSVIALQTWAKAAGLVVAQIKPASTRLDAGSPVPGLVVVLHLP